MSDPTLRELLERIKKIDAVFSTIAAEIAEQRADIEEFREVISLMNERFKSIEKPLHEYRDLGGAIVDHNDRLHALEAKLFPNMWPTIFQVEAVVGDLEDRYHLNHPLDRRTEKKP